MTLQLVAVGQHELGGRLSIELLGKRRLILWRLVTRSFLYFSANLTSADPLSRSARRWLGDRATV